jgi:hypothetical protein
MRQALLVGLGALMTLVTLLFLLTQTDRLFGGGSSVGISGGDPIFRPGNVEKLVPFIAENGPFAQLDPTGGDRDLWINHVGPAQDEGWFVFAARPLTSPRRCNTQWAPTDQSFVDDCDGTVYPSDGEGLPQYLVTVDAQGDLIIRLDSLTVATTLAPGPNADGTAATHTSDTATSDATTGDTRD